VADPATAVLVLPEAGPLNNIADVATLDAIARRCPSNARRRGYAVRSIDLADLTSASLCFIRLAQGLGLNSLLARDAMLVDWYNSYINRTGSSNGTARPAR
jgi:hypothetical protein